MQHAHGYSMMSAMLSFPLSHHGLQEHVNEILQVWLGDEFSIGRSQQEMEPLLHGEVLRPGKNAMVYGAGH